MASNGTRKGPGTLLAGPSPQRTGLTACSFALAGRGTIAQGGHADIVVFDATPIRDAASREGATA